MAHRFDLHCHSSFSDGTVSPTEIVRTAVRAKLDMLALTDHDCILGVQEAMEESVRLGLPFLPAVEMDNEWHHELHIIGLDIDINNPTLLRALEIAKERREKRNRIIISKLSDAGIEIAHYLDRGDSITTKLHIAFALMEGGYASDVRDAFAKYLRQGTVGYYTETRFTPEQVIDIIHAADGIPVLAHPCHIRDNPHGLVRELKSLGLMGIEAFYPSSSPRQTELYLSIAAQNKLMVTCGSDFHGANRPGIPLGCAWRENKELDRTYETLIHRIST
ncbi:MAG: PHP domain-containing protein [Eubacteriales bacterium]|nr:PHP domain-containing protein [Eubacteriales bacterium]